MPNLLHLIQRSKEFLHIKSLLTENHRLDLTVIDGVEGVLLSLIGRSLRKKVLVISPTSEDVARLFDSLQVFAGPDCPVYLFPEHDSSSFDRATTDVRSKHLRLKAISGLMSLKQDKPAIFIASVQSILQKTIDHKTYLEFHQRLSVGMLEDITVLAKKLISAGYQFESISDTPGSIAVRGSIIDVFPPEYGLPLRIEFWGNRIETIREFDPVTQKSTSALQHEVLIGPAEEVLASSIDPVDVSALLDEIGFSQFDSEVENEIKAKLFEITDGNYTGDRLLYSGFFCFATLLDYFSNDVIVFADHEELLSKAQDIGERYRSYKNRNEDGSDWAKHFPTPYVSWHALNISSKKFLFEINLRDPLVNTISNLLPFTSTPVTSKYEGGDWLSQVSGGNTPDHTIFISTAYPKRVQQILGDNDIVSGFVEDVLGTAYEDRVSISPIPMAQGWKYSGDNCFITVLTDTEIFGASKFLKKGREIKGKARRVKVSELIAGCFVVHIEHGIGRFFGTKFIDTSDDKRAEYIILEYANSDKVYVPVDQVDRITYYSSRDGTVPRLARLGSGEWEKTKARAKESAQNLAQELLAIYSKRDTVTGHAFTADGPWQGQLEDGFPYLETTDQLDAIDAVKKDMESSKPMDRLICGDVGYGKTEVALRAAFKAVVDGKQVAILVPTTVLAEQHQQTFSDRLMPFPVNIDVLSRLRSKEEQKTLLKGLEYGSVDIVIGTHRLLQNDVTFKDLGLVIIDEEQRFGVAHKDRFKKMRSKVDVLTMTATPIPRTLYISLAGIRDISKMETPPEDRLSVKTYVVEFAESLVKEAIMKEINRGGQVFYLHNRVADIGKVYQFLDDLLPDCRIGIAHGRLDETELSRVVDIFRKGEIDVLLCTTIIESGLHVDNANTLIVDNADRLGLGQLYQLRGRVGRGVTRGYAYFMLPHASSITTNSRRRLQTILDASDLGSGFFVAMRDLEIRGAGNILGAEQSGHVHAIGFDLYTRLIADEVKKLKETPDVNLEEAAPDDRIRIALGMSAFIPSAYISDLSTRLELYNRICLITDRQQIDSLESELVDRFGRLTPEVEGLLYTMRLKVECSNSGIVSLVRRGESIVIELVESLGGGREALKKILALDVEIGDRRIYLSLKRLGDEWHQVLLKVVGEVKSFNKKIAMMIGDLN